MAQELIHTADRRTASGWWMPVLRTVLSLLSVTVLYVVLRWAVAFIRDRSAPQRLLVQLYTALGFESAAAHLQESGLHPLAGKFLIMLVALAMGVAGVWVLYTVANDLLDRLPAAVHRRLRPLVFVGPAVALLGIFLIYPAFNTVYTSLSEDVLDVPPVVPEQYWASDTIAADYIAATDLQFERYVLNLDQFEIAQVTAGSTSDAPQRAWLMVRTATIDNEGQVRRVFTMTALGLQNYVFALTDPAMLTAFRNNVIWLLVGTSGSVIIGLLVAAFVDRVKREALAKSFIFLPLAISFVGASVIWRFVYAWQPPGREQIGLLNALVVRLGIDPIPWLIEPPLNTYALIIIMVWLQTGFCMVILSAALKGIPNEYIEAARIDGASERQIFFGIVIPMIRGALITVTTTVFIAILKVFDIVYVMTSGKFETEVIANRMFVEMFNFRNFGRASALAVVLLLVVLPLMFLNIRNLRRRTADGG